MRHQQFHRIALAICIFLLFYSASVSPQCFSSSWRNATSFTTDNSIGVYDFSNPSNSANSDNSRASASSLVSILSANTYYLKATGFGFSIPSYSSICGVTVEMECRATGLILTAAIRDNDVRLIKNGVISGTDHSLGGDWSGSDSYRSYGGSNDLWGVALLPSDVNASNFGVAISARIIALIAALPDAEIDHIRMRIDYNPILPVSFEYFKGSRKSNLIQLEWKTGEEEAGAKILLQRSLDNFTWMDLRHFELPSNTGNNEYSYVDTVPAVNAVQYRLKTILASGQVQFSEIRNFVAITSAKLNAFPNPVVDRLNVEGAFPILYDISGKKIDLPYVRHGNLTSYKVDQLPAGLYFVSNGAESIKILKR